MSNTFEFAERFGLDSFSSESISNQNRGFKNSRFGRFWETAIYNNEEVLNNFKSLKATFRIAVSNDADYIKGKYENEVVRDNTIKLYLIINEKKPINYSPTTDLRTAGIRFSNITEYVGVVLGNNIYDTIKENNGKQEEYVNKLAQDFIENDLQLNLLKSSLHKLFSFYMNNKRSSLFQLGLVGKLLQEELKKSLQEFWKPVLAGLANEVRTLKIEDEKYWQPYTKAGNLKPDKEFTPLIGEKVSDAQSYATNFLKRFDKVDFIVQDYLNLNKIKDAKKLKKGTQSLLKRALAKIYELFKDILSYFKNGILNFIKQIADRVYQLNAFLVGVINGVIEFVASLIELIGFMAGLLSGDAEQLWEAVKKEYEKLQEKGGFVYFFELLGKFFDNIGKRYNASQTKYKILKSFGEDLISIVEFLIGAIATFKAGKIILKASKDTFDKFKKKIDDLFDKRKDEFDDISPDNINGNGLYGGKILNKKEIAVWEKRLLKKFDTKLEKVDGFDKPDVLAQFDASTNTIKYREDVTEYIMAHESFHAEEMKKIGLEEYIKDAALKGVKESDYSVKNLIRRYNREKYVYDKLKRNINKYNLNGEERWHIEAYFYEIELSLTENNIKIPK